MQLAVEETKRCSIPCIRRMFISIVLIAVSLLIVLSSSSVGIPLFPLPIKPSTDNTRYLWCVTQNGPNNQVKDFVKCATLAHLQNLTLVIPLLRPHYVSKDREVRMFGDYYNLTHLAEVVKFITLDRFIHLTVVSKSKMSIDCFLQEALTLPRHLGAADKTLLDMRQRYGVRANFTRFIKLPLNFRLGQWVNASNGCRSTFSHTGYTSLSSLTRPPHPYIQRLFKHFHRSASIQLQAKQLLKQILVYGNRSIDKPLKPIIAVAHVRLGDIVHIELPVTVQQIVDLRKREESFTHLHIMCPYLTPDDIKFLQPQLPVPFTTTADLGRITKDEVDGYDLDIIEQEMAYQAPIFIATQQSSYSRTVMMQKLYQGKGTVYRFSTRLTERAVRVTNRNVEFYKK